MPNWTKQEVEYMVSEYRHRYGRHVTIEQLAIITGTKTQVVRRLVSYELIRPKKQNKFAIEVVPKVKKLLRLHHDLGVSWSSMELVLDLLEKIDELESKIQ